MAPCARQTLKSTPWMNENCKHRTPCATNRTHVGISARAIVPPGPSGCVVESHREPSTAHLDVIFARSAAAGRRSLRRRSLRLAAQAASLLKRPPSLATPVTGLGNNPKRRAAAVANDVPVARGGGGDGWRCAESSFVCLGGGHVRQHRHESARQRSAVALGDSA